MDRRDFMKNTVIASTVIASTGLWACKSKSAPAKANIRWSMGWLLWRDFEGRQIPLTEAVKNLTDLKSDGIEFTPRPGEMEKSGMTRESVKELLDKHNLSLSGNYFTGNFFDNSKKEEIVADLKNKISFLKYFGANHIVVGPPGRENGDPAELIKTSVPMLNELGKMALDEGVFLGIHPHCNTIIEQADEIELAMGLLDPNVVFMAPDTGHLFLAGNDVVATFRKYADRIKYIHFKDAAGKFERPNFLNNVTELGKGDIDYAGIMNFLKEINYSGWINVEQDHTFMTPDESSWKSMEFINNKLKPIYS